MAFPTTPQMQDIAARLIAEHMRAKEDCIRSLLGLWVSELEPTVIYDWTDVPQIKGIGMAGDPAGTVIVCNPSYRPQPRLFDLLRAI